LSVHLIGHLCNKLWTEKIASLLSMWTIYFRLSDSIQSALHMFMFALMHATNCGQKKFLKELPISTDFFSLEW
jgi:hypothetical protein